MRLPFPRVPATLAPNRLALATAAARRAGRRLVDLTLTNPTAAGFDYPADLLVPLSDARGLAYSPRPFGLDVARAAVAADYARRGVRVTPDRVILTSSTSEAYSLLFKLLCRPSGDRVLVPVPSYPLFEHLTRLDGVDAAPYRLDHHGRWPVDVGSLDAAWTRETRAVLAVSPNNPTGSVLTSSERALLDRRCAERDAALIVDEVFADFPLIDGADGEETGIASALTFRLGGLSKSAGLPQVKLGWIAVDGPEDRVASALEALELVCDTYLSVATPVQVAAPALIAAGAGVRAQILMRVRRNLASLVAAAAAWPAVTVLLPDAGWSVVVRVPATRSEDVIVLDLLERDVLVHPGYFFDFPHEAYLVLSLLPEPAAFDAGVRTMLERAGE